MEHMNSYSMVHFQGGYLVLKVASYLSDESIFMHKPTHTFG
jgi:hypothetical protein